MVSLAVLAVGAGVGVWKLRAAPEPAIRFETAAVERGRLGAHATASGTLSALVTVQVGSQVSGRIEKLFVDFNSTVKKGDIIAKIDPPLFEADVQKARANALAASGSLAKAKAEALNAERQYARIKELRASGLASQSELEASESASLSAKAQVDVAKGSVEQARAALHQAEVNLAYTTIRSPIDGVVISRSVDVGQTVAASLSAPTLFTIAEDLRKMQVDTFVAEADVGKLKAGMAATFTVDAFPGRRFKGALREIRNAPQTVQNVVTYDAVIDVDNSALELKPGMTANVTILVADKEDVLKVPNSAFRFRPPAELAPSGSASARPPRERRAGPPGAASAAGTVPADFEQPARSEWKTIWVLRDGRPSPVRIRGGITDGTSTEVVEGELEEGAAVITLAIGGSAPAPASSRGGSPGGMRRMF